MAEWTRGLGGLLRRWIRAVDEDRIVSLEREVERLRAEVELCVRLLREHGDGTPPRPRAASRGRRRRTRLPAAAAFFAVFLMPRALLHEPWSADATPPAPPPGQAAILRFGSWGFGLGEAKLSDGEIAGEVERRLRALPELAGERIDVSVRDGWVWLRGNVDSAARAAVEKALVGLPEGVVLVDQLEVAPRVARIDNSPRLP